MLRNTRRPFLFCTSNLDFITHYQLEKVHNNVKVYNNVKVLVVFFLSSDKQNLTFCCIL